MNTGQKIGHEISMKTAFLQQHLKDIEYQRMYSVNAYRIFTCWPWGLCKIWATAASVSVLAIWDTQGSGKLCTTLAGVTGVTGVPKRKKIQYVKIS